MPAHTAETAQPIADIGQRFTKYLRKTTTVQSTSDKKSAEPALQKHELESESKPDHPTPQAASPKRGAISELGDPSTPKGDREPNPKRHKSPPPLEPPASPSTVANASVNPRNTPSSTQATSATAPPQRSRAKVPATDRTHDFEPVPRERKSLWQDGNPGLTKQQAAAGAPANNHSRAQQQQNNQRLSVSGQPQQRRIISQKGPSAVAEASADGEPVNALVKQPETRPIGQDQLVAEVKGIYAGLVMVENKCIEVDKAQNSLNNDSDSPQLNTDQWQALIALHRTLLHEHHDFFLASQHPSASPALRRLASKYAMPARMWRHGIHSFLELLRHRLPHSLEYMLTFIYSSYSMMALLYETVPAFEYTWIECLGDLSRYRMAIEDDNVRDREIWTAVSRHWYSRASDKAPTTGRLYHHFAILARPNVVAQLFYYAKSLCVPIPFNSARESILTLFEPIFAGTHRKLSAVDLALVKCHGIFFTGQNADQLEKTRNEFISHLDLSIARSARRWLESGYQIAITNLNGLLDYGLATNVLMRALFASTQPPPIPEITIKVENASTTGPEEISKPEVKKAPETIKSAEAEVEDVVDLSKRFKEILQLVEGTDTIVLSRFGDLNILSYLNVRLMFIHFMANLKGPGGTEPNPPAMSHLEASFPWHLLTLCLNSFAAGFETSTKYETDEFPRTAEKRPLPEDWAMRGLVWAETAFSADHFTINGTMEDDERVFETPSMGEQRRERCLWLGYQIARVGAAEVETTAGEPKEGRWITYDPETKKFRPAAKYVSEVEVRPPVVKQTVPDDENVLAEVEVASVNSRPEGTQEPLLVKEKEVEKPVIVQSTVVGEKDDTG